MPRVEWFVHQLSSINLKNNKFYSKQTVLILHKNDTLLFVFYVHVTLRRSFSRFDEVGGN